MTTSTTVIADTSDTHAGTKQLTAKQKYDVIKRLVAERPDLDNHEIGRLARARAETVQFVRSVPRTAARPYTTPAASAASAVALVRFLEAAERHLPLLNAADLKKARAFVASDDWA